MSHGPIFRRSAFQLTTGLLSFSTLLFAPPHFLQFQVRHVLLHLFQGICLDSSVQSSPGAQTATYHTRILQSCFNSVEFPTYLVQQEDIISSSWRCTYGVNFFELKQSKGESRYMFLAFTEVANLLQTLLAACIIRLLPAHPSRFPR